MADQVATVCSDSLEEQILEYVAYLACVPHLFKIRNAQYMFMFPFSKNVLIFETDQIKQDMLEKASYLQACEQNSPGYGVYTVQEYVPSTLEYELEYVGELRDVLELKHRECGPACVHLEYVPCMLSLVCALVRECELELVLLLTFLI